MKRELFVSVETFTAMLADLIASGVTFEAEEVSASGEIRIKFLGGF